MRAGPIDLGAALALRVALGLGAALVLACQAPPGPPSAGGEAEPQPVEPAPAPEPAPDSKPEPAPDSKPAAEEEEDVVLAEARRSIVGGRISPAARRQLAESNAPAHRRATRLLQVLANEEPSPTLEPEPTPEPEPIPDPTPTPTIVEPPPEPEPEPDPDADTRIDDLDPRRFPAESAVGSWFVGNIDVELPVVPDHDPFAGLRAREEPGVLLPIDRPGVLPKVILTRLDLLAAPGVLRLEIVGSGSLDLRVQALDAHHLRLHVEQAGAVPSFLAARPSQPELAVIDVRRGRGCVEVDLELAFGWALILGRTRSNGSELEFADRSGG